MIGSFKELNAKRQAYDEKRPGMALSHPVFESIWLPIAGSVLSGVLMALSFPGYGNSTVVYASLVPLMFAVQSASTRRAAWLAVLSGFVFFMMSLSWLGNLTGTVEGIGLQVSAILGYIVLALYCSLYFVPFALAVSLGTRKWVGGNLWKNVRFMAAVSMVWVGSEYLRGFLFTGFPWNPLGVSQYANPTIIQVAQWGGVSIVSAYIVWMNAGIFITFRQYTHGMRFKKYSPHYELMVGILPVALAVANGIGILFNRPDIYESVNVALIQPNIAQQAKWDDAMDQQIRVTLEELTSAATRIEGLDLVIWPETALPDFLRPRPYSRESYELVDRLAEEGGVPILVGTMDYNEVNGRRTYFNSSILIGTNGAELGKYDKQHLVPFGEYVPFPGLMRKFTPIDIDFGHGRESTLIQLGRKAAFSVLICFEDTVAPLARNATLAGARWLVNQTNDAWFDPSAQSEQHLAHAVFRCVENRIPMARCCNTGMSVLIDAYGNIERGNLEPRTKGFRTGTLCPRVVDGPETFYTRFGDVFAKICLMGGATVLYVLRSSGFKRKAAKGERNGVME